jgi:hypothetical protein
MFAYHYETMESACAAARQIFSEKTLTSVTASFSPVTSVNATSGFISISNNQFAVGTEPVYTVAAGNTALFGLPQDRGRQE